MAIAISNPKVDALVVGARCAGAATAMLLARRGVRVLAVDRSALGSDTLSTHALMRPGVMQLERWGVLDTLRRAQTPRVGRTVFQYGTEKVDVAIKPRFGVGALYAPRRSLLDRVLADAARENGAEVRHGLSVVGLTRSEDGAVSGAVIRDGAGATQVVQAGIVIGADGVGSRVARAVGAQTYERSIHASATLYGYFTGVDMDAYRWYYDRGVGVGAIPTNDGLACVFVSARPERLRAALSDDLARGLLRLLREAAPELADELEGRAPVGSVRGFGGHTGYLRQSHGPGWALVGDAGYFKDPITAHGITDAFRDAELVARAFGDGSVTAFAEYQKRRDDLSLGFLRLTDSIASFRWTLPELQAMHRSLSAEMVREAEVMAEPEWAAPPKQVTRPVSFHAGSNGASNPAVAE